MSERERDEAAGTEAEQSELEGGSYEILRSRLQEQGRELRARTDRLNARRTEVFGGTELSVVGNERVRTEHNCVPIDIVALGHRLLLGFRVFLGLKTRTEVGDVFSLHNFGPGEAEGTFDVSPQPLSEAGAFLQDERFAAELAELFQYYKEARLQQLRLVGNKLLAIFQVGLSALDTKVFRWNIDDLERIRYLDNRGERDHVFPPSHDFEWTVTTREDHVLGRHPHVSLEDICFVETVGGDLTIKVEDNTEDGLGIYREPVEDAHQSLDDAQIHYARVGGLLLIKVLPYREDAWRYFVFNSRTRSVERIDGIGQACVLLPEDHGVIFPGGYLLQNGEHKVFEGETDGLEFQRAVRSPNGEDVLYVFLHRAAGRYVLLPYNVIRKEVQTPIHCHGYSIFDDGKMVVFRITGDEASRIHPMQIWQTPFTSADFAASGETDGSFLSKVGNADLVRGISDAYSLCRLCDDASPDRRTYEDLVALTTRMTDAYYWLDHAEAEVLSEVLRQLRRTAEQVIDEFEKVLAIRGRAEQALVEARTAQEGLGRELRGRELHSVEAFMEALGGLRRQRGRLIGLRELRYMDLDAVQALDEEAVELFEQISRDCVAFLLTDEALTPLSGQLDEVLAQAEAVDKRTETDPLAARLDELAEGLSTLSEVASGLEVDDATARARILEGISEVFSQLNRVRAVLERRRKALMLEEGKAEFAAQFKLLGQEVEGALARAETPEGCDEGLGRLMLQLEEIESRFSEFDEFLAELAGKRDEIYEAFAARKQTLVEERQRRAQHLLEAADRILDGMARRARTFKSEEDLNSYFSSDPMPLKVRQLVERLGELGESVKADELESRLKAARQEALRLLRDRSDLFEEGDRLIRLGRHRFSVNTQPLELTMLSRGEQIGFHLTGTDYFAPVEDPAFAETQPFWQQPLLSETAEVYRAEYLAASLLFEAEQAQGALSLERLQQAALDPADLLALVRKQAAGRYDEGYERGVHDADAAAILGKLLELRASAGLLRFSPDARALACLFWALPGDAEGRVRWGRRGQNLARLRGAYGGGVPAVGRLAGELGEAISAFCEAEGIAAEEALCGVAGAYLAEELLAADPPQFVSGGDAETLRNRLLDALRLEGSRESFEEDLRALAGRPAEALSLAEAWLEALMARQEDGADLSHALGEAAALLVTGDALPRRSSTARTTAEVSGLLGQHPRLRDGVLELRLDEFLHRLGHYVRVHVPAYRAYRKQRQALIAAERERLRLDEFKPRVLSSFVRNRLVSEVYLPLIGDNLAKQLGAAGAEKRTDLMGMLLLVSPPGYGKTTLMEYLANQLGLIFVKVNGPSLGHGVTSLDPTETSSATARQEVDKINLAFEMGNNVMLYLDDIQHTNPELLQKFISLCDAQRRVEGVWRGRTRTYDLRGKRFCMVMAGNPYTERGERFQIPDMLANRADTYNLGDILEGKDHLFALSYIENTLTSNATLAPLAGRDREDIQRFIRMARGEEVPATDLAHPYSAAEISDITAVFQHLFACQELLLKVNLAYIESAAQDDAYRTEPPFQLQGSYRNMNKLAEKVAPAMNQRELQRLISDHYVGEAQTLTSGAEHNLLKLGELRGTLSAEEQRRWDEIRAGFQRRKRLGGSEEDPAVRVVGQLGDIAEGLQSLGKGVSEAARTGAQQESPGHRAVAGSIAELGQALSRGLEQAAARAGEGASQQGALAEALAGLQQGLSRLERPQLEVNVATAVPQAFTELFQQQLTLSRQVLEPLVKTVTRSLEHGDAMHLQLAAIAEDLKRLDGKLRRQISGLASEQGGHAPSAESTASATARPRTRPSRSGQKGPEPAPARGTPLGRTTPARGTPGGGTPGDSRPAPARPERPQPARSASERPPRPAPTAPDRSPQPARIPRERGESRPAHGTPERAPQPPGGAPRPARSAPADSETRQRAMEAIRRRKAAAAATKQPEAPQKPASSSAPTPGEEAPTRRVERPAGAARPSGSAPQRTAPRPRTQRNTAPLRSASRSDEPEEKNKPRWLKEEEEGKK